MAVKRQVYDEDDGRTIVDMSGVERPHLISPGSTRQSGSTLPGEGLNSNKSDCPWEKKEAFTREERRWYVLGALKAALLIALAFLASFGLFIALLLWLWGC